MFRLLCLTLLLSVTANCYAIGDVEADEMADLTAMFVYLKNNCGQKNLPDHQLREGLVNFAHLRHWDLSNYNTQKMQIRTLASYQDLSKFPVGSSEKCRLINVNILGLLSLLN